MKPGTPGFVSARLREAMEARAVTSVALADMLGVSVSAVSQYANGHNSPAPDVTRRLSEVLNLPVHYFLRAPERLERGVIFYRWMSAATKQARKRAERRYGWLREIAAFLHRFVQFPKVIFPDFGLGSDPQSISQDQIEELASRVRRHWNLGDGPISNVTWLLENHGAIVARQKLYADKLDAFSEWDRALETPYVVLGADKACAARSRFDVAHELGHMVLHRLVKEADLAKSEVFKLIEAQADRFAGAFLLPERTFSEDFFTPTLDSFCSLKSKWRVSVALMIMRAAQLGLISQEQERRLWINRTRRGWRNKEPLDDVLDPELPRFLRQSVEMLVDKKIVARHDFPFQLALPSGDIEDLLGLRPGYFDEGEDGPEVLRFSGHGRQSEDAGKQGGEGGILHFPAPGSSQM
jgi:Zn-dependent peptidase ImmA (M78 family)/plasmid maintenance system antidote protein VapI